MAAARGLARRVWLVAAAITMGGGIWSMHFVAMLAFIMPIPMSYDIGLTTLSLVVAIFVTGGGFYVISRQSTSPLRLVFSGIFMGLGHYRHALHRHGGNAGARRAQLRAPVRCALLGHSDRRVDGGTMAGIPNHGSSLAKARCRRRHGPGHFRYALHGDARDHFYRSQPVNEAQGIASLDQTNLALAVAGITFVILAFVLIASLYEEKRAEEALREAKADLAHVNRVTTMGELTASLAHEVNQPIAAAVINANACLRWLTGDTPNIEEARASAMSIVEDGTRAAEIISRIRLLFKKGTSATGVG